MSRIAHAYRSRPTVKERHWWVGVIVPLAVIIWFLDGPYQRFKDARDAGMADWVAAPPDAPIIIVHDFRGPDGKPLLTYTPCARRTVRGEWTARTELQISAGEFVHGRTAKGSGSYGECVPRLRTWDWLFEGSDIPVPRVPYRICVFYDLDTPSGVHQQTKTHCSERVEP